MMTCKFAEIWTLESKVAPWSQIFTNLKCTSIIIKISLNLSTSSDPKKSWKLLGYRQKNLPRNMKLFSKKNCRKRPSTQHSRRRRILCFGHFCLWDWWSYEPCWRWKSPRFGMEQHWLVSFLGFQSFLLLEFSFLFKKVCETGMCNYFQ